MRGSSPRKTIWGWFQRILNRLSVHEKFSGTALLGARGGPRVARRVRVWLRLYRRPRPNAGRSGGRSPKAAAWGPYLEGKRPSANDRPAPTPPRPPTPSPPPAPP